MALVKDAQLIADPYVNAVGADGIPATGAVIVSLEQWREFREALIRRPDPVGVWLKSDHHPEVIAGDLPLISLVALEFPDFKDGRAYSYARLVRERYGFEGELRAVGDVLLEQLHFMQRVGFDAFEIDSDDPLGDFETAANDFSVWYQPTADGRPTAIQMRHRRSA